ncbi:helix-turn-helix protein [Anaerobacterium chartisolvens]|uniref:Helix-turn-helix protein n=1 Tax=Anaerobacterium chartisolvens TaxID=1297424 RepID=A0A369BE90_9FIRM|nr:helix-turn-helix transcriptional regulator [Anaerobacterium chartisolvens]RCX18906.1 helix-turn-helix protein [Anaerobacterium chartisolvens]
MDFAEKIKKLRKEKNLSQEELGKAIDIPYRVIGFYETNKRFPQEKETLIKFADFFNVSIDWLLGRTEIRSFSKDGSNIIYIDSEGLSQEDMDKIKEYASMLKNKGR